MTQNSNKTMFIILQGSIHYLQNSNRWPMADDRWPNQGIENNPDNRVILTINHFHTKSAIGHRPSRAETNRRQSGLLAEEIREMSYFLEAKTVSDL